MKRAFVYFIFIILYSSFAFGQVVKKDIPNVSKQKVVKITQNVNNTNYDFTTGSDKYYGTNGAKEIQTGVWGMIAGDTNGDGGISGPDYTNYQNSQGNEGYEVTDFNLDGGVSGPDYTIYQNNQGKESAVPN